MAQWANCLIPKCENQRGGEKGRKRGREGGRKEGGRKGEGGRTKLNITMCACTYNLIVVKQGWEETAVLMTSTTNQ